MNKKYLDKLYEKRQSAAATIARLEEQKGNHSDVTDAKVLCTGIQLMVIDELIEAYIETH